MRPLVVSDTSIFIDLYEIDLLDAFFRVGWEIHTTDFVIQELTDSDERERVLEFEQAGLLTVKVFSSEEMLELLELYNEHQTNSNLSLQDCSVMLYAKNSSAMLLTGDARLRKKATQESIDVRGSIYVLDVIKESGLLPASVLIEKAEQLALLNPRLPKNEMSSRISQWKAELNEDLPMEE